eukprot:gene7850-5504_t
MRGRIDSIDGDKVHTLTTLDTIGGAAFVKFGSVGKITKINKANVGKLVALVEFAGGSALAAPEMLMSHAEWVAQLPGGFRLQDVVCTAITHSDGNDDILPGTCGMVVGPSPVDKEERFLVDFGTARLWHVWYDTVVREAEYAYFTRAGQHRRPTATPQFLPASMSVTVLSEDPPVYRVDNFLCDAEIQDILKVGKPLLQTSKLQVERGGHVDAALRSQSFGDHTDFFLPGATDGDLNSGQRVFTCFLYLNDDFDGGETIFPLLNLTVVPKKGSMVLWRNVLRKGKGKGKGGKDTAAVDGRTVHRGNPVLDGVKYAANLWVVERPFELYRTTLL